MRGGSAAGAATAGIGARWRGAEGVGGCRAARAQALPPTTAPGSRIDGPTVASRLSVRIGAPFSGLVGVGWAPTPGLHPTLHSSIAGPVLGCRAACHDFVMPSVYISTRIVTEARKRTSPTNRPTTGTSVGER